MTSAARGTAWGAIALTALGPAAWGTTYLVTTEWLPPGRPMFDAAVRALPAGLLLVGFTRVLPRGIWWLRASVLGALNIGIFFALLFVAAYRLPGGVAAAMGAVQPLIVTGLSVVLLGQRLRAQPVLAGFAGVVGVSLLVLRGEARLDLWGVVAALLGTASMAAGVVLAKRWGRPAGVGLVAYTGWLLAAGGLMLVPVALLLEGVPSALTSAEIGGLVYLATVNTAFAYLAWLWGIQRLAATSVTFLTLLAPVVATILGWLVLDERLTLAQGAGLVLALGGVVAAQLALPSRLRSGLLVRRTPRPAVGAVGSGEC